MDYESALSDQARRARTLADDRRCPHCHGLISLLDALSMVRGHGVVYYIKILLRNGDVAAIPEPQFSPQAMLWGDDEPIVPI